MDLQFLGATRQVTGSQYCLEANGTRVLIDCGMFQERPYLGRNWDPFPVDPRSLQAVLLTHAHVDHCGLLPRLVQQGYRGPVLATPATVDLVGLVLHDSAQIQAEDANFKRWRHRKEGRQGRYPETPLYGTKDVERAMGQVRAVPYLERVSLGKHVSAVFHDAGHILGSAMIELVVEDRGGPRRILFSGDVGQVDRPILRDPAVFTQADYVVMESTYGNRDHDLHRGIEEQLGEVIGRTIGRGGNVVVPVFAVERTQEMMYYLGRLTREHRIPEVEVILDSPMAASATRIFDRHRECFDSEMSQRIEAGERPLRFHGLRTITNVEDSKALNHRRQPAVIMATSGMCVAGRIKHHLRHNLPRPESTILFVGYQGRGTLGRQILDGQPEVRIHGLSWPVRAEVAEIHGFSGHADRGGLLRWLDALQSPPRHLFLTHGEEEAALALAGQIRGQKQWMVSVPEYLERFSLD